MSLNLKQIDGLTRMPPVPHLSCFLLTHAHIHTLEMPLGLLCHYQVTNDLVSDGCIKMECVFQSWREQTL